MNNNANNNAEGGMAEEVERLSDQAWDNLCDKDDRTILEEYPDMCLITRDELADIVRDTLSTEQAKRVEAEAQLTSVHEEYALCRQLLMERTGERDQARAACRAGLATIKGLGVDAGARVSMLMREVDLDDNRRAALTQTPEPKP